MKLDELATKSGVSARTVRYYIQRGLLPAPAFRGPDTSYDVSHLERLRAIRALQERHLPLDEIASELAIRSPSQILGDRDRPARAARASVAPARAPHVARTERRQLARGVELLIDEDAPAWARELADRLTAIAMTGSRH